MAIAERLVRHSDRGVHLFTSGTIDHLHTRLLVQLLLFHRTGVGDDRTQVIYPLHHGGDLFQAQVRAPGRGSGVRILMKSTGAASVPDSVRPDVRPMTGRH